MDKLALAIYADGDGTAELTATVDAQGFRGLGAAWFDCGELAAFCDQLNVYPLGDTQELSLAGGYWDSASGDGLVETHLSIRIAPQGLTGRLCVQVELAQPLETDKPANARSVSTWFAVGYNDLTGFQSSLRELLTNGAGEAVLTSTLD